LESILYTKQSVRDYLIRAGQLKQVRDEVEIRMEIIAQGKAEFPESDVFYVLEDPTLTKGFQEWVVKLHSFRNSAAPSVAYGEGVKYAIAYLVGTITPVRVGESPSPGLSLFIYKFFKASFYFL